MAAHPGPAGIHVLYFGKPIFEWHRARGRASDLVRAAYLGSEDVGEDVGH